MTDTPRRQRLSAEARREAILAAARDAFAHGPYEEVSIAAIAAEAGASEPLVHRYFDGKAGLYAQTVQLAFDDLEERQAAAVAQLPRGVSTRDRVARSLEVYLDHIAGSPSSWAAPFLVGGNDPAPAREVRQAARDRYVRLLRAFVGAPALLRHDYALHGYFGFLDAACVTWVERGCPADERWPLMDAALGALQGALGDWGS